MHKDFAKILKQHLDFRGIEKGTKAFFEWVALLKLDISEEYGPKAYYESLARLNGGANHQGAGCRRRGPRGSEGNPGNG